MSNSSSSSSGGISFFGLLTILFVGLKLTHYIDWSWWWVLAPIWIPAIVAFSFLGMAAIIFLFVGKKKGKF